MKLLLSLSLLLAFSVGCSSGSKKAEKNKVEKEAKKQVKKDVRTTECKSNSDIRTISVQDAEGGGFEVIYTKFGNSKSIANGGRTHCEKIRDRIKANLENAGFTCS